MVYNKKELERAFSPKHSRRHSNRKGPCSNHSGSKTGVHSTSNMRVVIRIRPMTPKEQEKGGRCIVKAVDDKMLIFDPPEDDQPFFFHGVKQGRRDITKKPHKEMEFVFDRVFDQPVTNYQVYEGSTKGIITSLLDGFNCSVFAYGATGAGKTYTMLGTAENPGITYLTVVELFTQVETLQEHRNFELWVSYLEVYNENVHDLLKPGQPPLHIREDGICGVIVTALTVKTIKNAEELLGLLSAGNTNRTQHPTDANAESSRSHAVFQLYIRMTNKMTSQIKQVKLSMIDLAGSERGSATGFKGLRFTEGANINKSLLALGNCINGLADGLKHIPYRDSKLTRILKDSLGGNCQTVMIANVSPFHHQYEDTYNTLKYATRAKKIKTKIQRNIVSVEMHVAQYVNMVEELKREIAALKESKACAPDVQEKAIELDLSPWKKRVSACYEKQAKLHMKIMRLEKLLKSVQYRRRIKEVTGTLLSKLHFQPTDLRAGLRRVYESMQTYQNQEDVYKQHINQFHLMEKEATATVNNVLAEMETAGLKDQLQDHVTIENFKLASKERDIEVLHLQHLVVMQQSHLEQQNHIISELSQALKGYHQILEGHNKTTNAMDVEYQKLGCSLENMKALSWGQVHEISMENDEEGPVVIPPKIKDTVALSFTKHRYESGDIHNISRLDASKEDLSASLDSPIDYSSFENYYNSLTKNWYNNRAIGDGDKLESPCNLETPIKVFNPNQTFVTGSQFETPSGRTHSETGFDIGTLNSTFVLHSIDDSKLVLEQKSQNPKPAQPNLKRVLVNQMVMKKLCDKENNIKDKHIFVKPGPCVPKAPRIVRPGQIRTPLASRSKPNTPVLGCKDLLKISRPRIRPILSQGHQHPYSRLQIMRPVSSLPSSARTLPKDSKILPQ